ncbi:glycosyltransferase family A protein [Glaciimonas sp. CA11.2]|uniref:glycosyltransferase family 2 protein n=1 Tax=Glaciimonas sp. CA11.2 TaxID=3048601 RepID=UPI002AB5A040|nr:glycosyltransferase family A protein [Glaciimonas sp. CA11.2]MDY7545655.1 glycosyltransferase family A protein [Glaciimonas sp. CA11.2]
MRKKEYNVSVVIPNYNGEKFIAQAIECILAQNVSSLIELIIVDDASTDNSVNLIEEKIRDITWAKLVSLKINVGRSKARNLGVAVSKYSLILFLDNDDLLPSDYIKNLLNLANITKLIEIVIAGQKNYFLDGEYGLRGPLEIHDSSLESILLGKFFVPTGFMISKNIFEELEGFDALLHEREDWDFASKLCIAGYSIIASDMPVWVRLHQNNNSKNHERFISATLKVHERLATYFKITGDKKMHAKLCSYTASQIARRPVKLALRFCGLKIAFKALFIDIRVSIGQSIFFTIARLLIRMTIRNKNT